MLVLDSHKVVEKRVIIIIVIIFIIMWQNKRLDAQSKN